MREIKFRVWDKSIEDYIVENEFVMGFDNELFKLEADNIRQMSYVVGINENQYVIEQYTGLVDCKGNEIYEGDIVNFLDYDYEGKNHRYKNCVVKYENCSYYLETQYGVSYYRWIDASDFEVIGNVHDK